MEFLMTYGWAIMIVLVAIAALFFLGVFSSTIPSICTIEAPFNCIDSYGKTESIALQFGALRSIRDISLSNVVNLTVNGNECLGSNGTILTPTTVRSGLKGTLTIKCGSDFISGEPYNGVITIQYVNKLGGITKRAEGTFSGQIRDA